MKTFIRLSSLAFILLAIYAPILAQTWIPLGGLPANQQFNALDFDTELTGYVVGDQGTLVQTLDGGTNWQVISTPQVGGRLTSIEVWSQYSIYVGGEKGMIYRSLDGGSTWSQANVGDSNLVTSIHFFTPQVGYASSYGVCSRSTDGGQSWQVIQGMKAPIFRFQMLDDSMGFAVGCGGTLFKTFDQGQNWLSYQHGGAANRCHSAMHFLTPQQGFIGTRGSLLSSQDGGNNWTSTPMNPSSKLENVSFSGVYFFDSLQGVGVPSNQLFSAYRTQDGGQTWEYYPIPGCGGWSDLVFPTPFVGYGSSYNGKVYKFLRTPSSNDTQLAHDIQIRFFDIQDKIKLTGSQPFSYELHAINGQSLRSSQAGSRQHQIRVASLAPGIYILHIRRGNQYTSQKIWLRGAR